MSTPWPPPAPPSTVRTAGPWLRWGPLIGWLALAAGSVLAVIPFERLDWASGGLGGRELGADGGDLANVSDSVYPFTVVLLYVGLVLATVVGLAAVPATRRQRWALVGALVALTAVVVLLDVVLGDPIEGRASALVNSLVLLLVPGALVLFLAWRGARRGSAVTALVAAGLAALAHVVTVVALTFAPADVGPGSWLVLLAVLVALGGAVLLERTTRVPR